MSWPQIALALKEKRHELCLTGKAFSEHLGKHGLDAELFQIASLNYLSIHNTTLDAVDEEIALLEGLQTLSLHSNKLTEGCAALARLEKLKVLDLSQNSIDTLGCDLSALEHLTTLNLSNNRLKSLPVVDGCVRLQVIDVSHNALQRFTRICHGNLSVLSDVKLANNQIEAIPPEIEALSSLKNLDLFSNCIAEVPHNLINCTKLKELNLKENPVKDRRLLKLIEQCRTKQVVDYLKQHAPKESVKDGGGGKKKGNKGAKQGGEVAVVAPLPADDNRVQLRVKHANGAEDALRIVLMDEVKPVRPNIVCCLLHGLRFTDETFRKFIQLQNRMHETICERRNAATIATHDAKALEGSTLVYTAVKPKQLRIRPLNAATSLSGAQLFDQLQAEADSLRREKKRNVYSGIHKYLYLLEGKPAYACLVRRRRVAADDDDGHHHQEQEEVISFPPITNSEVSKVSVATESVLLEVTSHANVPLTRRIADVVLEEVAALMGALTVEQLRVVDVDGNLRNVYPSKTDLSPDACLAGVVVVRE